jgi:predicted RND superfamily exporter protein
MLLALCVPLVWAAARLSLRSGAESLLEGDPRSRFTYQLVGQSLMDTAVLVVVQSSPDTFTRESLGKLRDVSEAFAALPGVRDVKSFTHSSIPVRKGMSLEMQPYLPAEWTDENLATVRAFSLEHPLVRNLLVSPDARHAVLLVAFQNDEAHPPRAEIESLLARFADARHSFQTVSRPLVESEVWERAEGDLLVLVPTVLVCVLGVLALYFRSARLLVFLVLNLSAHALLSAGVCALLPFDSGVYLLALLPLLAAIQLTLLIHLGSEFRDHHRVDPDAAAALRAAVGRVFRSSLFAALTTAAGFLALLAAPGASNHAFGILGAACTMLGFALLFTLGPLSLLLLHRSAAQVKQALGPAGEHHAEEPDPPPGHASFGSRRGLFGLAGTLIVLAAGLSTLPGLRPNLNLVDFLPTDSPARATAHFFDREFAGMYFLRIDLDSGRMNGVVDDSFLRFVQRVEAFAAGQPAVTAAYSHASVIAMINQVWSGWAPGSFCLPDSALKLGLFHTTLLAAGLPMTQALGDAEWRTARLYVRTRMLPSATYIALHDAILAEARRLAPAGVSVEPAPGLRDFLEGDRNIVRGQVLSAAASITAIGLCLLLLWRSAKLSLVALLCVCAPMGAALGIASWLGVTLNSITVMAGAIVLGVAVDDAVHFVTRWQELASSGLPPLQAAAAAHREKRGPIILTSVVLLAVFVPLSFSAFPPVRGFAIVSALSFAGALACVLLLLPRVLAWQRRR